MVCARQDSCCPAFSEADKLVEWQMFWTVGETYRNNMSILEKFDDCGRRCCEFHWRGLHFDWALGTR